MTVAYSYVGLIRGLLRLGDADLAGQYAAAGMSLFADNPDVAFQAGLVEMEKLDYPKARTFFELARTAKVSGYGLIGMRDKEIQLWRAAKLVADIDFMTEQHQLAYNGYIAVLGAIPADFEEWHIVYARLVELAAALGDLDALPKWTFEYIKRRPSQLQTALQVARQVASQGDREAARSLLLRLEAELPGAKDEIEFVTALGQLAELCGDDADAVQWYQRSAQLGNRDASFWLNLAGLFVRNGNDAAAQQRLHLLRNA